MLTPDLRVYLSFLVFLVPSPPAGKKKNRIRALRLTSASYEFSLLNNYILIVGSTGFRLVYVASW